MRVSKGKRKHKRHITKGKANYKVILVGRTYYSIDLRNGKRHKLASIPKHHNLIHHKRHFKRHLEGHYKKKPTKADFDKSFRKIETYAKEKAIPFVKKEYEAAKQFEKDKVEPFLRSASRSASRIFKDIFKKKTETKKIKYSDSVEKVPESKERVETSAGSLEKY